MTRRAPPPLAAATILAAARKKRDPEARAAYLEAHLPRADKPAKLVELLLDAWFDAAPADAAAKARALAATRPDDAAFLAALGGELENHYCEDEALDVLRLAVAAGANNRTTLELLGRMLVLRGDAEGVPLLQRVIDRDPTYVPTRIALAAWFVERDPARALAVLGDAATPQAHDLRAMIHEAAGRPREAARELRAALADDAFAARKELCDWHFDENRIARALVHARALFVLRLKRRRGDDLDDADVTIAQTYRLAGAFAELVPWLRERAELTPTLGWNIYYALAERDEALAVRGAEAALRGADEDDDADEVQRWRVRIASVRARHGAPAALDAVRAELGDDATAWIELADAYVAVGNHEAARAAVERARRLDPDAPDALSTLFDLALAAGDGDALHRHAEAIAGARPHWHQGPEHLGRSFARRCEPAAAATHAARAVAVAPYCPKAWIALAEAHVVGDELAAARDAAARARALAPARPGDDLAVLDAALAGEPDALERALAARYRHLAALPFPAFVTRLRAAARSSRR